MKKGKVLCICGLREKYERLRQKNFEQTKTIARLSMDLAIADQAMVEATQLIKKLGGHIAEAMERQCETQGDAVNAKRVRKFLEVFQKS